MRSAKRYVQCFSLNQKSPRLQNRRNDGMLDAFVIMYKDSNFIHSLVNILSLAFRAFCEPSQQMETLKTGLAFESRNACKRKKKIREHQMKR